MDVVVQDDDPDHHPEAERHRLLAGKTAAVLPEKRRGSGDQTPECKERGALTTQGVTYGVSNMTLHTLAIVLKQSVVFSMGRFLFCKKTDDERE